MTRNWREMLWMKQIGCVIHNACMADNDKNTTETKFKHWGEDCKMNIVTIIIK